MGSTDHLGFDSILAIVLVMAAVVLVVGLYAVIVAVKGGFRPMWWINLFGDPRQDS